MNFWEANRKLLLGAGVALLAALIVHMVMAGGPRNEAIEMEKEVAALREEVGGLTAYVNVGGAELVREALADLKAEIFPTAESIGAVQAALLMLDFGEDDAQLKRWNADLFALARGTSEALPPDVLAEIIEKDLDRMIPRTAEEIIEGIKAERAGLEEVLLKLEGVLLAPSDRYQVPAEHQGNPEFYFDQQLGAHRAERCSGRRYPPPDKSPLGFTPTQRKEKAQVLLYRLAAVDRLAAAVGRAGLTQVHGITHGRIGRRGPVTVRGPKGDEKVYLELLPMTISASTDERGLVAFLQEISGPGNFLALIGLKVEVTDTKSRTFKIEAAVVALMKKKGPAPSGPQRPRQFPVGRY